MAPKHALLLTPNSHSTGFRAIFSSYNMPLVLDILTQKSLVDIFVDWPCVRNVYAIDTEKPEENHQALITEIPADFNLWRAVRSDRFLIGFNHSQIYTIARHHFTYLSSLFSVNSYDCIIGEVSGLLHSIVFYLAQKNGINFNWPLNSPWEDRFFLLRNKTDGLGSLPLVGHSNSFDPLAYHDTISKSMSFNKYVQIKTQSRPSLFSFAFIRSLLASIKGDLLAFVSFISKSNSRFLISYLSRRELNIPSTQKILWTIYAHYLLKSSPQTFSGENNFCIYYLHYEPDLSTLVWASYYQNQLEIIKNIASSLPPYMKLIVKEHPLSIGLRRPSFYKSLKRIPNVVLMLHSKPPSYILPKVSFVVTINGTIGWEALMLYKNVITFGPTFYSDFKGVLQCTNFNDLSSAISDILYTDKYRFSRPELLRFIEKVHDRTYEGNYLSSISLNQKTPSAKLASLLLT